MLESELIEIKKDLAEKIAELTKANEMEGPFLEPGIKLCNRQIAVVEESLSGLVVTGEKYLRDYATENKSFDRMKELVDEIIMHLNAKVTQPKNTNGNGRPLP